jgi:hypothetical protein
MTQEIPKQKSTNSQTLLAQIHKYVQMSTNILKYAQIHTLKRRWPHVAYDTKLWHYPHDPEIQKKIHKFTNPICTNPQIHPNTYQCRNNHMMHMIEMILMRQNDWLATTIQEIPKLIQKSTNWICKTTNTICEKHKAQIPVAKRLLLLYICFS